MRTQEIRQFPVCACSCLHLIAPTVTSSLVSEARMTIVRYLRVDSHSKAIDRGKPSVGRIISPTLRHTLARLSLNLLSS